MKINGLDKLEKQFKQMERGAKELSGTKPVPFNVLFPSSFMRRYTTFLSMDELLAAGNFTVESQEDFEAIPEDMLDKHVASSTKFKTWEDMLGEATSQYVSSKLGF